MCMLDSTKGHCIVLNDLMATRFKFVIAVVLVKPITVEIKKIFSPYDSITASMYNMIVII